MLTTVPLVGGRGGGAQALAQALEHDARAAAVALGKLVVIHGDSGGNALRPGQAGRVGVILVIGACAFGVLIFLMTVERELERVEWSRENTWKACQGGREAGRASAFKRRGAVGACPLRQVRDSKGLSAPL